MNKELKVKVLGATALALLISACATHKNATETPPPPEAGTSQNTPAATAGSAAPESAQTSSATGNGGALQSSQLPSDNTSGAGSSNASTSAASAGNSGTSGPQTAATGTAVTTFYFDYDSSALHPDEMASLQAHAAWLAKTPAAHVRVEGNCDERGTREYNMALGERRAKAVAAFLTSNGASDSQLEIISYGKEKPAVDGHDEAAWSKNRRVELHYTAGQP